MTLQGTGHYLSKGGGGGGGYGGNGMILVVSQ